MTLSKTSYALMYMMFAWTLGLCYGFVLLSSAQGEGNLEDVNLYEPGKAWNYQYQVTLLLNEKAEAGKDVGFFIVSEVLVQCVWGNSNQERLLKLELKSPKLFIKSRKNPSPEGFVQHSSNLENLKNQPFYIYWNSGKVEKVLLMKDEPLSMANLKKGIASLFQFKISSQETTETDISGHCNVRYSVLSPYKFRKYKSNCNVPEFKYVSNPELLFTTKVTSNRVVEYELNDDFTHLDELVAAETHEMFLSLKEEVGNKVIVNQHLNLLSEEKATTSFTGSSFDEVLNSINKEHSVTEEALLAEKENVEDKPLEGFQKSVNNFRDLMKNKHLGSITSAKAMLSLISTARRTNKEEIAKTLGSKKNEPILNQLYDILGFAQTFESHEGAMKKLHFEKSNQKDQSERYLWSLSMSSQPNAEILQDLVKRYKKAQNLPEKVEETLLLTIGSMAHRLGKVSQQDQKIQSDVKETLIHGYKKAKGEKRFVFLRALRNFKSKDTIPDLLEVVTKGTIKEGMLAWKAIASMDSKNWDERVLKVAFKTFFQLDKKHDSSSRTLALKIILALNPTDQTLKDILYFLLSKDKAFEIKQYVLQTIKMNSDLCPMFKERVLNIIKSDVMLNNYGVLAQRGLSTALSRSFLESNSSSGQLVSVQEMSSGIVKRGTVDVVMSKDKIPHELFTLEVFSGGLSSFLSSDSDSDPNEVATAGMELTVLGTQLRPFTFFSGQGELMGHVWSGTGSERTTAYQALLLPQEHLQYIRLSPGFIAELDFKGAASFDLAGKIEISLWNRNAESLVEKAAGVAMIGLLKVDTEFVKSQVEFTLSVEPKLQLQTDIDFSSGVQLCMRLSQPDTLYKHNVFKIERIPGSKHKLRKARYKKELVAGKTYSLNKKNNEMCSAIFS